MTTEVPSHRLLKGNDDIPFFLLGQGRGVHASPPVFCFSQNKINLHRYHHSYFSNPNLPFFRLLKSKFTKEAAIF